MPETLKVAYLVRAVDVSEMTRRTFYELAHVEGYCPILKAMANMNVKAPFQSMEHPYGNIPHLVDDVIGLAKASDQIAQIEIRVDESLSVDMVEDVVNFVQPRVFETVTGAEPGFKYTPERHTVFICQAN